MKVRIPRKLKKRIKKHIEWRFGDVKNYTVLSANRRGYIIDFMGTVPEPINGPEVL